MLPYVCLILTICILAAVVYCFSKFSTTDKNKIFICLSYVAVALFVVLRKYIGNDHLSYVHIYDSIAAASWGDLFAVSVDVEPAFRVINKLFSITGLSGDMFVRVYMMVLIALFFIGGYKHSSQPFWYVIGLLTFMYVWFGAIRQATATAIVLLGFGFVKEKKPIKFLLTVILACLFHLTAVVAVLIYPAYHMCKHQKAYTYCVVVLSALVVVFREQLVALCQMIVGKINHRYEKYFSTTDFGRNMFIILIGLTCLLVVFLDRRQRENKIAINIMLLAVFMQSCSAFTHMAGRFIMYLYPLIALSLERLAVPQEYSRESTALLQIPGKDRYLVLVPLFMFLMFFWWYTYIRVNPYVFIV